MSSLTYAFFGATGGCAGTALAAALNAGHRCTALARNPDKLTKSIQDRGVSSKTLDDRLVIVKGNAKVVEDVKKTLAVDSRVVDGIMFGIGMSRPQPTYLNIIKQLT